MSRKSHSIILFSLLLAGTLMFIGCEGEQGPAGPAGSNPASPPIITAVVAAPDSVGSGGTITLFCAAYDPNGDDISYAWTVDGGTLSSDNQALVYWTAPPELGLYLISVTATDVDGSVDGSATVGVNVYVPSSFPSYLGDDANRCSHCHEANVDGWMATAHANAWETLVENGVENNPYCIQCHVTGYDNIMDADGNVVTEGVDNGGFDQNPIVGLRGVQCEACHGAMGPSFTDHAPDIENTLNSAACARCHDVWHEAYLTSAHGTAMERAGGSEEFNAEWNRSGCYNCHISEGFLKRKDSDWVNRAVPAEGNNVTCVTCHDPHAKDNEFQLRGLDDDTLAYGGPDNPDAFVIEGWGNGQLCTQCHHARRSWTQIQGQLDNGSAHPGPHSNPQTDMIAGVGSYEIPGYTYEREAQHSTTILTDMCVNCHMYGTEGPYPGVTVHSHSFWPLVNACQQCHGGVQDFDVNGVQTEITNLLDELRDLLPHDTDGVVLMDTLSTTYQEREAGYCYYFVHEDKSNGVHNAAYARSILQNAIDYMNSGVVADNRGR